MGSSMPDGPVPDDAAPDGLRQDDNPAPDGPAPDSTAVPAPVGTAMPGAVGSPVPRRSWPGRERGRGLLPVLAALVFVAGAVAGLMLNPAGRNRDAAGATASLQAITPGPAASAQPSAVRSLSAAASTAMASTGVASTGASGSAAMTATPSASADPASAGPASASPAASARRGTPRAASMSNCAKERPGNGTGGPATLAAVLADANSCSRPRYLIPAVKCAPAISPTPGEQVITCDSPASHIVKVRFRTYPTLPALYGAYGSSVGSLYGTRTLKQNTRASCGAAGASYAEGGWNHQGLHPRQYTATEMAAGKVPQLAAMGRLACFSRGTRRYLVWTTDIGRMLAVVTGNGSPGAVYRWWAALHHVITFPGTEMCGRPERMNSVPQGNLVRVPVCPAGPGTAAGG
jgi:hypothetical protein